MKEPVALPGGKLVSIVIPCFNEEENIAAIYESVRGVFERELSGYPYEIIFADNKSMDGTRAAIRAICALDPQVRAVFNTQNVGFFRNAHNALLECTGDCAVQMCADFQDPPELLPEFVRRWESGYKIVCGVKSSSDEGKARYLARSAYYSLIRKMASVDHIDHFLGFGLYDREFLEVLRGIDDPDPYLRGMVAELGFERKEVAYKQPKRRAGRSHFSLYGLYDAAMLGFTSYTKTGMRLAVFMGFGLAALSLVAAAVYFVLKLMWWDVFPGAIVPALLAVLLIGAFQLMFTGLLGEYVMEINFRSMRRPLAVIEERLNFPDGEKGIHP